VPTSELQRRLTRRNARTQQQIKVAARTELLRVWRQTFDLSDLDMSWEVFAARAMPVILANRDRSVQLVRGYRCLKVKDLASALHGAREAPASACEGPVARCGRWPSMPGIAARHASE